jgi:putative hydrolase of the HAD superfamily
MKSKNKIRAILFDVDNTLIDFMKMKQEAVRAGVAAMIAAGLPMKQLKAECEVWRLYDKFGYEYQKVFQKMLANNMKKVDYSILAPGVIAYRRRKEGYLMAYPGVRETLELLKRKGYRLGVLSDAPRIQVWLRLAAMDLHKTFYSVVTFDDTKNRKPHPATFKKAIKKLKVNPEHIVMVGDNIERDIKGARKFGMKTIFAKYGASESACNIRKKADFEITKFDELIGAIRYLEKISGK